MDAPPDLTALLRRPGPGPHRAITLVDGAPVRTLADLPPLRNGLLFVGLAPSRASVAAGHYHQGAAGRQLWRGLVGAGILPPGTGPEEADDALVAARHGITDLLKAPPRAGGASDEELTAGVGPLWQKVAIWRPAAVVFIDARAASVVAGRVLAVRWGALPGVALAGRPCLLLPGPAAPAGEVAEALAFFGNLAAILAEAVPGEPGGDPRQGGLDGA